jgi:hypothetical protein
MNEYALAVRREARLAKKLLNLGTSDPACIYCGVTDRRCLFRARAPAESAIRCRNCHAKRQRVSGAALERKRERFAAAGYPNPGCVVCSEGDLRALELDHLAGDANSAFVEPLCLNCHAKKSDGAEDEPWASLRVRDPDRGALAVQSAFLFGGGAVLTLIVAVDGDNAGPRAIFLLALAAALLLWALWDLSADADLTRALGPGRYYGGTICAEIPL